MSIIEDAKEYGNKAYDKAGELASTASKEAGGFFSNNKGFVIGLVVALTALFGMDSGSSGMVPMLFAMAALAVGIFADKDKGIFSGLFNSKSPEQNQEKGKVKELDTSSIPELDKNREVSFDKKILLNEALPTRFMLDKEGKNITPSNAPGAGVMMVQVNPDGKVTNIAITNPDGKFDLKTDSEINSLSVTTWKIPPLNIKKDANNKPYIDLDDEKTKESLTTVRNTIENLAKPSTSKYEGQPSLGELPSQTLGRAFKANNSSIEI